MCKPWEDEPAIGKFLILVKIVSIFFQGAAVLSPWKCEKAILELKVEVIILNFIK